MPPRREHPRTFLHPRFTKMWGKTIIIAATNKTTGVPAPKPTNTTVSELTMEKAMLNKVMLIGNLGAAPEARFTQNGTAVTTFSIATTKKWRDKDGQMQTQTEWHRIVTWKRTAEICAEYLDKGARVYIEGSLQTRKWKDQNGADRYTTEIVAHDMKMLSPKKSDYVGPTPPPTPEQPKNNNDCPPLPPAPFGDDVPF